VTKRGVVNCNLVEALSFEDYHKDIGKVDRSAEVCGGSADSR
jgi:hypothetical protein